MDEAAEAKQEKLKRIKENYPSYYVFVLTLSSEKKGLFFPYHSLHTKKIDAAIFLTTQ